MSKKFSELPPKESLDSADYIPIVDSADSNPETQNKIVTFQTVRDYFTEDLDEFLEQAQTAESARVTAENTRRSNETTRQSHETTRQSNETTREANEATRQTNETARENAETGYIQQAKSWAVGTNGVAREGDATDNAKYYAEQASASATSASASATSASASATTAGTAKDSAQASATQAAISAESVDAPALTKKILAAFPQESLSGSLLTLSDGADGIPAKTLTINLQPHQSGSGDPSPDNVRPISGYESVTVTRAGKNLLNNVITNGERYGVTYVRNADGSITASGTSTSANVTIISSQTVRLPKGTYILSGGNATVALRCNRYNAGGEIIDRISNVSTPIQIVVDDTVDYLRFYVYTPTAGATVNNFTVYPLLRAASFADDTYEPYTAREYDITIPTAAGTVYGGQLTVDDDGSGTLTVDRALRTTTWGAIATKSEYDTYTRGRITLDPEPAHDLESREAAVCNVAVWNVSVLTGIGLFSIPQNNNIFYVGLAKDAAADTPIEVAYKLASPTAYTLTASQVTTLLGDNTVWMDADGTIDLQYRADTQKYIDSRIALLNSNLAYIEDGQTASRAYSAKQYVTIDGKLYKVASAIASGATFTVGTNVVSTTVGTELTALN